VNLRSVLIGSVSITLVCSGAGCQKTPTPEPLRAEDVAPEDVRAAVMENDQVRLDAMIQAGVDLPALATESESLHLAVAEGKVEMVRSLLASGLDPNHANAEGITPIAEALFSRHVEILQILLESGAKADLLVEGSTPLAWSIALDFPEAVRLLLQHGADPNLAIPTPAPDRLIEATGDAHFGYYLRREKNVTPLMLAASMGQLETVQALVEAGANRNAKTARHNTVALWLAGKNERIEVMQFLLGKDPSPEGQPQRIEIRLGSQRAVLFRNGEEVMNSPISSGKKGFATPKGRFVVTNKYEDWRSTIYEQARMPFFMRLSCSDFGLHAGRLPGYPASHGCIRLPPKMARMFYDVTEIGTLVEITD
jgi:hypothetical protein